MLEMTDDSLRPFKIETKGCQTESNINFNKITKLDKSIETKDMPVVCQQTVIETK